MKTLSIGMPTHTDPYTNNLIPLEIYFFHETDVCSETDTFSITYNQYTYKFDMMLKYESNRVIIFTFEKSRNSFIYISREMQSTYMFFSHPDFISTSYNKLDSNVLS